MGAEQGFSQLMAEETTGSDADPASEDSAGAQRRRCAFSGCRAPLPLNSGPGNRPRYCQDGKTWGSKGVSCKQAGNAEDILGSIRVDTDAPPLPVTELSEQVSRALGPTRQLAGLLEQLERQLADEVVEAQRAKDAAIRAAADEQGLRAAADDRADQARQTAAEATERETVAEQVKRQAEQDRDRALQAMDAAERAQLRAETQRDTARADAARSEETAKSAAERLTTLSERLAVANSDLTTLRDQVDHERARVEQERQRSEALIAEQANALDALRNRYDTQLAEERARAADALNEAVARARTAHDEAIETATTAHARELGELQRRIGRLEHQLTETSSRHECSEQALGSLRSQLQELALTPGEAANVDVDATADLRQRLAELAAGRADQDT
ncbi:hypothetical protein EV191_107177 [Tamaricihabitans halophyticus]|uniref:Chromosome segregation ATPase n=1 Tax=Tamaricihabitans halophyticus TaxID=1262583 RepID=A0A4R2QMW2_9PSEU|nr:hypothetical protein [Tamaricihabitans halophyticus]TCP50913.1 hypothetical protein EV191_107177 [Tamaricihabitans halophyticus]